MLPAIIGSIATLAFGVIAVILSFREEKLKNIIADHERQQKFNRYEITILKHVQEKVKNPLTIDRIMDLMAIGLEDLLPYTSVSSFLLTQDKIIFKNYVKEAVSQEYIGQIKQLLTKSMQALDVRPIPEAVDVSSFGIPLHDSGAKTVASHFIIPIILGTTVYGAIIVTSTKKHAFAEDEMNLVFEVADQSMNFLSRLDDLMTVEKSKLIAMVESLANGLCMIDANRQVIVINNAAKQFLSLDNEHANFIELLSALPNTFNFAEKVNQALTTNQTFEIKDVTIDQKFFTITISPVLDLSRTDRQKVIGAIIHMRDITLEKSVAKMKEDFTNIMVHELRSPLTSIKASTQLLTTSHSFSDQERDKLLSLISQQATKLLAEVGLILDAAKLEAGVFTVHKIPGDMKALVQERVNYISPQAQEKFIKVTTEIDPAMPNFSFDPIHMGQVIDNLLSNSMKFTPSGGTIHVSAKVAGTTAIIAVSDSGQGIPKDKQHLLFQKFSQIASPNAKVGTGLGLYLVKGVIEAHGGNIKVASEEGHGTTFTFVLPIDKPQTVVPQPTQMLTPAPAAAPIPQQLAN